MPAPPDEVTITSVGDLLGDLVARFDDDELVWFRGQARASFTLQCSLARRGGLAMERELMAEFRRDATPLLAGADLRGGELSEWDWLFIMQHYGVPTRLLDWSESPLSALFFALDDEHLPETTEDAVVWALLPQKLNEQARITSTQPWDVPLCDDNEELDRYSPSGVLERRGIDLAPAALTAVRRFDRIRAQTGVFTIMFRDERPLEETSPETLVKYVIPNSEKSSIGQELRRLGVHAAVMYPDLQHVARRVSDRIGPR